MPLLLCACQDACDRRGPAGAPAPGGAAALAPDAAFPEVPAALAHLERQGGTVTVQLRGRKADVAAAPDQQLYAEDLVKTGPDGEVDVVFAGNNRIHLGHNAALLLHDTGSVATQVGAVVLKGSVRASSGGTGVALHIGTPVGMAKLGGDTIAVLDVDMGKGLSVSTGDVVLARPDRLDVLPLKLNQTLKIDALPVLLPEQQMIDVPAVTVAHLAPPPPPTLPARLAATTGRAERQVGGKGAFRPARAGELLVAGDRLRLAGAADTAEVDLDDGMSVQLRGGELDLRQTENTAQGRRARYALRASRARLRITSYENRPAQEAEVAGATLKVAPGSKEAKVDVDATRADAAHVVVRFGRAQVGTTALEAGQAVDVRNGQVGAPYPAFAAPVALHEGRATVLYVGEEVPPVRFGGTEPGAHHVELAQKADFARIEAAEDTDQAALATDEVPLGTTYWRTGGDASRAAKLDVVHEAARKVCRNCQGIAAVDDDGRPNTVMYAHVPPDTTLRWSEVAEAAAYRLVLVREGTPPSTLVDEVVKKTRYTVASRRLREANYHWSVTPLDAQGASLAEPKDNGLRYVYDNVTRGLNVRAPHDGAQVDQAQLLTSGEVEPGATLQIDGRQAQLSEHGQFRHEVALRPGRNRIVYRVMAPGVPERIWIRTVDFAPSVAGRTRR